MCGLTDPLVGRSFGIVLPNFKNGITALIVVMYKIVNIKCILLYDVEKALKLLSPLTDLSFSCTMHLDLQQFSHAQ